jgi:hypothetical protein
MVTSTALLFICLGLLLGSVSRAGFEMPGVLVLAVLSVSLILLAGSVTVGVRAIQADNAYLQARIARRTGGNRLEWAQRAVVLHPYNLVYIQELDYARRAGQ